MSAGVRMLITILSYNYELATLFVQLMHFTFNFITVNITILQTLCILQYTHVYAFMYLYTNMQIFVHVRTYGLQPISGGRKRQFID